MLVPAYLNIHVHGAVGHDVMEGTPEALQAIGAALAGHGVGAYYPTTVTSSTEETLRALDMIAGVIEREPSSRWRGAAGYSSRGAVSFRSQARRPPGCSAGASHRYRCSIASGKLLAGIFAS